MNCLAFEMKKIYLAWNKKLCAFILDRSKASKISLFQILAPF